MVQLELADACLLKAATAEVVDRLDRKNQELA